MARKDDAIGETGADVPLLCSKCGAVWLVAHAQSADPFLTCFGCRSRLDSKAADAARRMSAAEFDAARARSARIRLHWFDGFVSEYPDPLDEDTQAVSLNAATGLIVLHAITGDIRYFEDAHASDDDGFAIFRERPHDVRVQHRPEQPRSEPQPFVDERVDYVAVLPAGGGEWQMRARADEDGSTNGRDLVGRVPIVRLEPAGVLRGGGAVSALCGLARPAVLATRVTLTALDPAHAAARAASFHLEQGFVDALRPGDVVNFARSRRGGLAMSVIREQQLAAALGAVTAVPLGELKATVQRDRVVQPIGFGDTRSAPWLHPVQITTASAVPRKPRAFSIRIWYGAWPAPRDSDECVSIVRRGFCSDVAASTSTLLLAATDALHIER